MVMRIVCALAIIWSVSGVANAAESANKTRFNQIRTYVWKLDRAQFDSILTADVATAERVLVVTKTQNQGTLNRMLAELVALPGPTQRPVTISTCRGIGEEAMSIGDRIFISEKVVTELLNRGRGDELEAMIAHELGHPQRDFIVKRAIENDSVLTPTEKEFFKLELELEADRTAQDLFQRLGKNQQSFINMLKSFGDETASRVKEAEGQTTSAGASRQE